MELEKYTTKYYFSGMKKRVFSIRLDDDILHRLVADSRQRRLSRGHLVREAIRSQLGLDPPGQALAEALANGFSVNPLGNGHET